MADNTGFWDSMKGSLANAFKEGGTFYTGDKYSPGVQGQIDNKTLDSKFAEKGSILGMTPGAFSSAAGQLGSTISQKGSWQDKLGSLASQMGSAKIAQLAKAEQENRTASMLKQLMGAAQPKDLAALGGPASVGGVARMKNSGLTLDPQFQIGGGR